MIVIVAHGEEPAVDHRVERLDAPVHHFWKAGEVGDVAHLVPHRSQRRGGSSGRDQFDAVLDQPGGKRLEPVLVR